MQTVFMSLLQQEARRFSAAMVEAALEAAQNDGRAVSFTENGMGELTRFGQQIADDEAAEADAVFSQVVAGYLEEIARFDPSGPYLDEAEHGGNEYKGAISVMAQDALERIVEAHGVCLRGTRLPAPEGHQDHA